jgi:DnaK suppressor protein
MINQTEIDELKAILKAKEEKLIEQIRQLSKPVDMGDDVDSFDEEADEAEEFSTNMGTASALNQSLQKVQKALLKIGQGGYGICQSCNSEISMEMLKADPETELCRPCKQKQDQ